MLLQSDKSVEGLPEARKKTSPTASWVMSLNIFCVLSLCVPASQLLYLDVCFFFLMQEEQKEDCFVSRNRPHFCYRR